MLIHPPPSRHYDTHLQANPVDRCQDHQLEFVRAFQHETPQIDGQFRVAAPQRAVPFLGFRALLVLSSRWCHGYIELASSLVSFAAGIHYREFRFADRIFLRVELTLIS